MKSIAKTERKGEKNPDKHVIITVSVSGGFLINADVLRNLKREIGSLATYTINNLKEEEETWP